MSYEPQIRSFLVSSFGYRGMTQDLGAEVPLLDQGILDSTGVLEIAGFFESDLGVTVDDEDMVPDNFGSVARLVAYVARKKGG
jgi:acyl carrier protein